MFVYNNNSCGSSISTDYILNGKLSSNNIRDKTVKRSTPYQASPKLKKKTLSKANIHFLKSIGLKTK